MPSLDTNILLRWLLDDVPEQTAAADALVGSGERLTVPDVALIETVYVLERVIGLSRATVALSVETVLGVANLDVDRTTWRESLDDYLAHPKASMTDAYLAAQAGRGGRHRYGPSTANSPSRSTAPDFGSRFRPPLSSRPPGDLGPQAGLLHLAYCFQYAIIVFVSKIVWRGLR